ncbi:MAG: hypothetical protein ABJA74_07450 [Lapillicoccus sp.]
MQLQRFIDLVGDPERPAQGDLTGHQGRQRDGQVTAGRLPTWTSML